jgi:hypothetical protein
MHRGIHRQRGVLGLCFLLSRQGFGAGFGLALAACCVVGFGGLAVACSRHGQPVRLSAVPLLASSALAFGAGPIAAIAAAAGVAYRDEREGIHDLCLARGVGAAAYATSRTLGLAAWLACLVGGGSALVGVCSVLVAKTGALALQTAHASFAAAAFGLAFAAMGAPLAVATLGAQRRVTGYLTLLALLTVPGVVQPALRSFVAPEWLDVCSIPGALLSLREALGPGGGVAAALRSLAAVALIASVGWICVRVDLARRVHGHTVDRARR